MTSRDEILQKIKKSKPDFIALSIPTIDNRITKDSLLETFTSSTYAIGGSVEVINNIRILSAHLSALAVEGNRVVNRIKELDYPVDELPSTTNAAYYETIDVACIKGIAGVAENAAIWIDEECMGNRLIPFICQHLILLLSKNEIVNNMHDVYKNIDTAGVNYGVFIAGPSKTADIEQSLVIGAHGARSLKVFILD